MGRSLFPTTRVEDESQWVSVSDLMSGLMLIFLCIAVFFMRKQVEVAKEYQKVRGNLAVRMEQELDAQELERWGAEFDREGLIVRFLDQETLFEQGTARLSEHFKTTLEDFFPQFVGILQKDEFRESIREVRIEGHTSSEWRGRGGREGDPRHAYLQNMKLSQRRAYQVLEFTHEIKQVENEWGSWLNSRIRANGLSSSKLIYGPDGSEDRTASRRVEFRVVTDAEDRMQSLVERYVR